MNARETLKALDEQRAKVLEEARSAALQKAREALGELRELGLHYSLVESPRSATAKGPLAEHPESSAAPGFDQSLFGS